MSKPVPFATTMDYCRVKSYADRAIIIPRSEESLARELWSLRNVLRASRTVKAMILDSNSGRIHPDLLATILMRLRPASKRPVVIFIGDMWQKDPGLRGWLQKQILRLADPVVQRYAPLSTDEFARFSKAWGIPEDKLRFVPYFHTFDDSELTKPLPPIEDYIFAGGNTHRDYRPLLEAARLMPGQQFVFATNRIQPGKAPANVTVDFVSHEKFVDLMRRARAVVVPMRRDLIRSAGHQTYLNAMMMRKPVIVNNIPGAADHIINGETGFIVEGTPESYVEAIGFITDPANRQAIDLMALRGFESASTQYTMGRHAERVMEILDEALAGEARGC